MMKKVLVTCLLSSAMSVPVFAANFADDYEAALKLKNTGKYAEAQAAFVKLSEVAPTPQAGDDALVYAVQAASRLQKFDEANAIAVKIKDAPTSKNCRMELMLDNFKSADLVAEFKDEDISTWPEKIAAAGFYKRGCAYLTAGDNVKAAADLEKAVEKGLNPTDKVNASYMLGIAYKNNKDDEKALSAFAVVEKYPTQNGGAAFMASLINASIILTKQGKFDDALAKLNIIDQKQTFDYHKANVIASYGDVYAAKGDKAQASAKYKEAMAVEKAPKSLLDAIQKKLDGVK
jgi:tetratricopeptide (TPR) repeat protein